MPNEKKDGAVGFNNLTKVLSFNLYDFCITLNKEQQGEYVQWVNQKYSSQKIFEISKNVCEIIEADVLSASVQDYEPVGASTLVLMSDIKGGGDWKGKIRPENDAPDGHQSVNLHLNKSHITAHTYPDAEDPNGICSFRVDFDIATCGSIIPLKAINYLFQSFECDVVIIDYVVRGFTRLPSGKKIYNDDDFNSIQDFIDPTILETFKYRTDLNMGQMHTWQTKLMINDYPATRYLMNPNDSSHSEVASKMDLLQKEMKEVYNLLG
jgi:S-adenosylmethionine decarboxylase